MAFLSSSHQYNDVFHYHLNLKRDFLFRQCRIFAIHAHGRQSDTLPFYAIKSQSLPFSAIKRQSLPFAAIKSQSLSRCFWLASTHRRVLFLDIVRISPRESMTSIDNSPYLTPPIKKTVCQNLSGGSHG